MASYRAAVEWIATEDAPGDGDEPEVLAGYLTVCLVADLFGKDRERVAEDVYRHRIRAKSERGEVT